ncbi:hypothetical protein PV327_008600 [Microctonus hyperodae]|uniref:Trehalase n=1 Tax=Microctonus hyperodae TaxID=165561 RepID=A0AA39KHJ5_MICHY|nr:hypothetical protein PV327_008600 [Microctonus hyperodae]
MIDNHSVKMSLFSYLLTILFIGYCAHGASIPQQSISTQRTDLCDSKIYCNGELLKTVQLAKIFPDSKTFVDHYQLQDPDVTMANFAAFMTATNGKPNRNEIAKFVEENFALENEVLPWLPPDWEPYPLSFKIIEDENYRDWAYGLNQIWKNLSRQMSPNVIEHPERHSFIPVENGFVVPGGRFQESYYWDSYWVVEGLLLSGMPSTAKGIISNFLSMVRRFGFIPNGGRVYYLMRSQPPLLIPMMKLYVEFTSDIKYLSDNLGMLEKEFLFFHRMKTINVTKNNKSYLMARYVVNSEGPRPESYREDYKLAQTFETYESQRNFYNNMKAGAESGWDFSSRWFIPSNESDVGNLTDISTCDIIPVDLNAFLQNNAQLLSRFNRLTGNFKKAKLYRNIAMSYQTAIDEVLWNDKEGVWLDYDIKNERPRNNFYPTNLTPLYTRSFNFSQKEYYAKRVVEYLKSQGIGKYMGGVPSSIKQTGQQWDSPNAWPPLQSIVVQGLRNTESEPALSAARELADRWLKSNYMGYVESEQMYEKYDAMNPGAYGGGGEYVVQPGFGWTNGVVLEFLFTYPDLTPNEDTFIHEDDKNNTINPLIQLLQLTRTLSKLLP